MAGLAALFSGAAAVGFSGGRAPSRASLAALAAVVPLVPAGCPVSVGCARGIDAAARAAFPAARVFVAGAGVGAARAAGAGLLAARSAACVRSLPPVSGLWVSFPSGPCPAGLLPSPVSRVAFGGFGSGSWSSAAFALGRGVPVLVFVPAGPPPGWGFAPVPGAPAGWWLARPLATAPLAGFAS